MKVVVIDDDPTGSQTVHGCPLLLRWDPRTLQRALRHPSPLLFLLADTRALDPSQAAERNREIATNLDAALTSEGLQRTDVQLVSRGDSTLRGHGVLEPQVLQDSFGPFDATLHIPAFLEGGRTTVDGVHLLHGEPVHTTPFARDRLFAYTTSDLAVWLEEKSRGMITAAAVQRISGAELDQAVSGDINPLVARLTSFRANTTVIVDAERQEQLSTLAVAIRSLQKEKRFLFRTAASWVKALADPGPQPLDAAGLAGLRRYSPSGIKRPGLVMVGSYVPLADQQLVSLLEQPECVGIELPIRRIARVLDGPTSDWLLSDLQQDWTQQIDRALDQNTTPVLYTTRGELAFASERASRLFSRELAALMARLAAAAAPRLGYLISKGGTTTQTLLADGLKLKSVQLEGQLLPGLSVVRSLEGEVGDCPILTFPGNLGDKSTLLSAWKLMCGD